MIFFTVYQILKFAFQGFWRNFWLSIVTISVIILAFISINFLIIINRISENTLQAVKERVDVSIYLKNDTDEETIKLIENELKSITQVSSVQLVTEKEALETFRQKHKNDPLILQSLEELDSNPLGATFIIKAKNINEYNDIIKIIDNSKYNSSILDRNYDDNKVIIDKIENISMNITRFGVVVTSVFIIISLLIVFNTIKLAIYTHQKEIGIMKLVGASDSFISFPYIVESVMYAIFACVISIVIIYPLLNLVQPYVNIFFGGFESQIIDLREYYNNNFYFIFGIQLIGITFLNILASGLAVRRYLKV